MAVEERVAEEIIENVFVGEGEKKQPLKKLIAETLGDKYSNLRLVNHGAQSYIFEAEWGPAGETRIIKVDRPILEGLRAKRYAERGCNNRNGVMHLANLPEASEHHIVGLIDFDDLQKDYGITISVHPRISGETLDERISRGETLNLKSVKKVFSDVIDGMRHYIERGQLHRDLNPSNIMIRAEKDNLSGIILDFENAGDKSQLTAKVLPTAGNRWITDPLLNFSGEERAYSEKSEIYSLADDIYFSITGKHVFEVDPDSRILKDNLTGESVLGSKGIIDQKKSKKLLKNSIKQLPRGFRRLGKVLRKALNFDETERYASLEDFAKEFEEATEPGLVSRFFSHIKKPIFFVPLIAGIGVMAAFGERFYEKQIKKRDIQLATAVENASKHRVVSAWPPATLELENNLIDLRLYIRKKKGFEQLYSDLVDGYSSSNTPAYIKAKKGEVLQVIPRAFALPWPRKDYSVLPAFPVRAYIEGFKGDNKNGYCGVESKGGDYWSYEGYYMPPELELKIPDNTPSGVYHLVVELDALNDDEKERADKNGHPVINEILFEKPGRAISVRRIPILVGNVKTPVRLGTASINYNMHTLAFKHAETREKILPQGIIYEFYVPELGYSEKFNKRTEWSNSDFYSFSLPRTNKSEEATLQVVIKDRYNEIVGCEFFPISTRNIGNDIYCWELEAPNREFYDKAAGYRTQTFERHKNRPISTKAYDKIKGFRKDMGFRIEEMKRNQIIKSTKRN
ncbi:hypothetical protein HYW76_00955 [Candidatus Pacearchaeota archaeon]|nr:hypothetical protein [Candidatus Pacearchaeota archaeon]